MENISDSDLASLANPTELDEGERLWLRYNYMLNYLGWDDMFRLSQTGVLLKRLQKFRYCSSFCNSCAFGKEHRRQWRHKGSRGSGIWSAVDVVPGACVSVDQLISAQQGLLAQVSDHLTR